MDQQSTSFRKENARLSKIIDKLLELFPDPYSKQKNPSQFEQIEVEEGEYLGKNEVSEQEQPRLQKLEELAELLPQNASSPKGRKFPNKNIQREEIFQNIYAKLHLTLVIGKYQFEVDQAKQQDQYRKFLMQTKRFLNKDDGTLSQVNLMLWTYIILNIDPKGEIETDCDERMACFMNTGNINTPQQAQVGQQIMDELKQFIESIHDSPVLQQIYAEFSSQFKIPCRQDLREAFLYCTLHYIHDSEIHGITLLDGTITMNLYPVTKFSNKQVGLSQIQKTLIIAYYLIVLLHESAHFFLRKYFNEYEINSREKVLAVNATAINFESGAILENIVMPPLIKDNCNGIPAINDQMAKFLIDPKSWQLSLIDFQNTLQKRSQVENITIQIRLHMGNHTSQNYIKFSQKCFQPRPKMQKR